MPSKDSPKYSRYVDPTGEFTNQDLKWGSWYVRHKVLLRKITIGVLVAWIVVGGVFSLYGLGEYLFSGYWRDRDNNRALIGQFENYAALQPGYGAVDLQIDSTQLVQLGESFDFFSLAYNPNKAFVARVTYKYVSDAGETPLERVILLPGRRVPLGAYGVQMGSYPSSLRLVVESIEWRKIDPHQIPNPESYLAERMHFVIEQVDIERNTTDGGVPPHITFDIHNDTAYSYYEGRFAVLLLSGSSVEYVVPLSLKNFTAGDRFPVDLRPPFDLGSITDIEVVPLNNALDQNEFLPVQ